MADFSPAFASSSGRRMPWADNMRAAFLQRLEDASEAPSPQIVSSRARLPLYDLIDDTHVEDVLRSTEKGSSPGAGASSSPSSQRLFEPAFRPAPSTRLVLGRARLPLYDVFDDSVQAEDKFEGTSTGSSPGQPRTKTGAGSGASSQHLLEVSSDTPSSRFVSGRARLPLYDLGDANAQAEDRFDEASTASSLGQSRTRAEASAGQSLQRLLVMKLEAPSKSSGMSPSRRAAEQLAVEPEDLAEAHCSKLFDREQLQQAVDNSDDGHRDNMLGRVLERTRAELLKRLAEEDFRSKKQGEPLSWSSASSCTASPQVDAVDTPLFVGEKARGSPSELSTVPTPGGEEGGLLQDVGQAALIFPESPGGSCSSIWCREDREYDRAATAIPRPAGEASVIRHQPLLTDSGDPVRTQLEERLDEASHRARGLWQAVDSAELLIQEMQARLDASVTSSSHSGGHALSEQDSLQSQGEAERWKAELAASEEKRKQLVELVDELLQKRTNNSSSEEMELLRRKATRLAARSTRLQEEEKALANEVALANRCLQQLQLEVDRLQMDSSAAQQERQTREKAQRDLHLRMTDLIVRDRHAEAGEASSDSMAKRIGQDWEEAIQRSKKRVTDLQAMTERHKFLVTESAAVQATIEQESQRLLRAEDEQDRRNREQKAAERLSKEQLAVAMAENAFLSEAKATWQVMRPQMLSLVEDLRRSSHHGEKLQHSISERLSHMRQLAAPPSSASNMQRESPVSGDENPAMLNQALQEREVLQAQLRALEQDKALRIREQEEMIRQVRSRVAPLQRRALALRGR